MDTPTRLIRRRLLGQGGFALLLLPVMMAGAMQAQPMPAEVEPRVAAAWKTNWQRFASKFRPFEDGYIGLPNYDRRFASSAGLTPRTALARLREDLGERWGRTRLSKLVQPPEPEEALAMASAMPEPKLGRYGRLESVTVEEILGPDSMLVTDLVLIDETRLEQLKREDLEKWANRLERREARDVVEARFTVRDALAERQSDKVYRMSYRLVGFGTRGLSRGSIYTGPKREGLNVGLVKTEDDGSSRRRVRVRAVLVPSDWFLPAAATSREPAGLDQKQFVDLLAQYDLTPAQFIDELKALRKQDPETADALMMDSLLPRFKPEEDE